MSEQVEVQEDPKRKFKRVIDIGDGAGVQVFYGSSPEELIDNLAKAQEHATRHIRDLKREKMGLKKGPELEKPIALPPPTDIGADDRFKIVQKAQDDPQAAVDQGYEIRHKPRVEALQKQAEEERAAREQAEAQLFLRDHPEYLVCRENADAMNAYSEKFQMRVTRQNLEIAFNELKEAGLLKLKSSEEEITEPKPEERIAQPETRPRAASTAIRSTGSSPRGDTVPKLTKAQIYAMPSREYDERMRDPEFRKLVDSVMR